MTDRQYKIKNDRLNKYKKTCNSLNHNTTFWLMANKSKNRILYLFSYFSLAHIFFSFSICTSFSKSLYPNVVLWALPADKSCMDYCYSLFTHYFFLFIVNLLKCFHRHLPSSRYVFFFFWPM